MIILFVGFITLLVILQGGWSARMEALRKPAIHSTPSPLPFPNGKGLSPLAKLKPLSDSQLLSFSKDGHLRIDGLFNKDFLSNQLLPQVISALKDRELQALRHQIKIVLGRTDVDKMTMDQCKKVLTSSSVDTNAFPFLQLFQLWRIYEAAQKVACSMDLAKIACQLLDVPAVRLYQDSLFVKRPGDGATCWHSDLNMAPFDTNDFLTCWIPLVSVPAVEDGGTGLSFASASHRDFALSYWYDARSAELDGRYALHDSDAFKVGDATFHHGWCLHSTLPNTSKQTRYAYSVSFVADQTCLLQKDGHVRRPDDEDTQVHGMKLCSFILTHIMFSFYILFCRAMRSGLRRWDGAT
ncbi:hypothetical protein EON65_45665 [archaeon]|nr:MAG: hypothetical protein EON65_45665 [archaeon]